MSPDGKRFLFMKDAEPEGSAERVSRKINIVLNWLDELKQKVPADKRSRSSIVKSNGF
jgi:hypothetical protein